MKHNGSHATFLDLDISIDKVKFIYKMTDKQDAFHLVRIPSITSNTPSIIFYSFTMSQFVRIARSTLLLKGFLPKAKNLSDRMISQSASKHMPLKADKKDVQ